MNVLERFTSPRGQAARIEGRLAVDISPGRDGKPAGGETVFCNATIVRIFARGFSWCFFLCGDTHRGDISQVQRLGGGGDVTYLPPF